MVSASIRVDGATWAERQIRRRQIEAVLTAVRSALEDGVVAGGGVAFINVLELVEKIDACGGEKAGIEAVKKALEMPVRQIVENAGLEGSVAVKKLKSDLASYFYNLRHSGLEGSVRVDDRPEISRLKTGFDVLKGKYVNMLDAGIVDAAKVAELALKTAASLTCAILTIGCIANISDSESKCGQIIGA